jgi:Fe-S oxidoreductase
MTQGEVIRDGWHSEEVKHSLDLCLSCKGCKSDCPVTVDLATYKAEFLSHYYENRLRPLNAYAFGNIDLWASLASNAPGLVNLTTQLPFLRDIAKLIAGIPAQRKIPAFAPETFKQWFFRTSPRRGGPIGPPREAKRARRAVSLSYLDSSFEYKPPDQWVRAYMVNAPARVPDSAPASWDC